LQGRRDRGSRFPERSFAELSRFHDPEARAGSFPARAPTSSTVFCSPQRMTLVSRTASCSSARAPPVRTADAPRSDRTRPTGRGATLSGLGSEQHTQQHTLSLAEKLTPNLHSRPLACLGDA